MNKPKTYENTPEGSDCQERLVRSLPDTPGFFWWRETCNDAWRVIHVISHELDGAVTDPDYLSTYDVHHHRWSGRSIRCWREYDSIGEWCEILPPNVRPLASLPTSKLRDKMDTPNDTPAPTKPRVAGCQQEPCSALVELVSFVENVVRYGALTHDTDKRKAVALLLRHNPTSEVLPRDNTPTVAVKGRPWGSGPCGSEMRLLD
jgi:hypothetical protein